MKIKTYKPEQKRKVNKEEAVPILLDVGSRFATLGGMISFFASSFVMSFRTFRRTKKKIREIQFKHGKTIDLT